ncbi:MAG: VWA domain-containing protein [Deltaproteobacteria bacterium]|nr:VWA domain-containing protein [Deltaproteobacteria bacterium]
MVFHPRASRLSLVSLVSLAIVLSLAMEATAQSSASPSSGETAPDAFFDNVSVDIVNVEVFVTNKKDQPVAGLSPESFELFVDGKPTPLTNFYAESGGQVVTLGPGAESQSEVSEDSVAPGEIKPEAQRLHLLIFADNRHLRGPSRKKSFKALREFLENQLDPADEVAVASLGSALEFRSDFTSDRVFLNRVLGEVEKGGSPEPGLAIERQRIFNDIQTDLAFSGATRQLFSRIKLVAQSEYTRGKASVEALGAVVDSLAGIRGRKAILHVSDGISTNPGEAMYLALAERAGNSDPDYANDIGAYDLLRDFQELARRANAAQVTFYSLDAEATKNSFARSADYSGGVENSVRTTALEAAESNNRAPLELAAVDTGGRRIQATGRLTQQLSKIANDFATFYSLGFRAPEASSKEKHRIEVKVKGKGLRVRHRQAYEDKDADRRSGDAVLATLLYNTTNSDLGVTLEPLAPQAKGDNLHLLPIRVKIPLSRVAFLPQGDEQSAQLSFFVAVKDDKGNPRPVQKVPFKLRIPSSQLEDVEGRTADYELPVVLHEGDRQVAIGVRDDIGGISSTLRLELPEG